MSENLSSNSLFHFTKKTALEGILKNGFYALYSEEEIFSTILDKKEEPAQYIPMVSFCDIPLSMIKSHCVNFQSYYGIGLSKEWATNNKINPVLYSYAGSTLMNIFRDSNAKSEQLQSLKKIKQDESESNAEELDPYEKLFLSSYKKPLLFLKPTDGIDPKTKEYRVFYNEKEWRYVPPLNDMINIMIAKNQFEEGNVDFKNENDERIVDINNSDTLNQLVLNNQIKQSDKYKLSFKPKDIRFIILNQNSEIPEMVDYLNETFYSNDPDDLNELKILVTKIITLEQLNADF